MREGVKMIRKFELDVEKQRFVHCYQGSERKEYCSLHQNCLGLSRVYV